MKIPKTLGACADQLFQLRNKRLQLQHDIDKLAKDESVLREHLIEVLPKSDATGVAGKLCRATVVVKRVPTVKDWDKLYSYISKNNAYELLQRRVNEGAITERWEAKLQVPGVEAVGIPRVSLNKL